MSAIDTVVRLDRKRRLRSLSVRPDEDPPPAPNGAALSEALLHHFLQRVDLIGTAKADPATREGAQVFLFVETDAATFQRLCEWVDEREEDADFEPRDWLHYDEPGGKAAALEVADLGRFHAFNAPRWGTSGARSP